MYDELWWAGGFRVALGSPEINWLKWLDVASELCFVLDAAISINTELEIKAETHVGPPAAKMSVADLKRVRSRR